MNAEQEARARKVLQDQDGTSEADSAAHAAGKTPAATGEVTNRTYAGALMRDYLGRRGRDMFSVGGSLRVGSSP